VIFSVYVPLLASLLLAVISRPLVSRLSPRTAARALVLACGLSAASFTWGMLLLALTLLRQAAPVTERAAPRALAAGQPVPALVAAAATAALAVGVYRFVVVVRSRRGTQHALQALCDRSAGQELVVVAAAEPHALAVPGRTGRPWRSGQPAFPGRILVTSGMLSALDGEERRVMLEHERAHLRQGHSWQQGVVDAAAAVNPLLRPARDSVAFLLERSADEAAAEAVADRLLTARSLARAALAGTSAQRQSSLAFHQLGVPARVAALAVAPPPARWSLAAGVVAVGLLTTVAAVDATVGFIALARQLWPVDL